MEGLSISDPKKHQLLTDSVEKPGDVLIKYLSSESRVFGLAPRKPSKVLMERSHILKKTGAEYNLGLLIIVKLSDCDTGKAG